MREQIVSWRGSEQCVRYLNQCSRWGKSSKTYFLHTNWKHKIGELSHARVILAFSPALKETTLIIFFINDMYFRAMDLLFHGGIMIRSLNMRHLCQFLSSCISANYEIVEVSNCHVIMVCEWYQGIIFRQWHAQIVITDTYWSFSVGDKTLNVFGLNFSIIKIRTIKCVS